MTGRRDGSILVIPRSFGVLGRRFRVELSSDVIIRTDDVSETDYGLGVIRLQRRVEGIPRTRTQVERAFVFQMVLVFMDTLNRKDLFEDGPRVGRIADLLHQALSTCRGVLVDCAQLPERLTLFAETVRVRPEPTLMHSDNLVGGAEYRTSRIRIQSPCDGSPRAEDDVWHTFFHELWHYVFFMLREDELRSDETLVDLLGGLLHQALDSSEGAIDLEPATGALQ